MKRIISLIAVVLLSTGLSFAQDQRPPMGERPDPSEMTGRMLDKMNRTLALTKEQSGEMETILNDFHKEMPEAHQSGREAMETLANSRDAKVEKILSQEQYKKYLTLMDEMRKDRESKRGNRQGPPR